MVMVLVARPPSRPGRAGEANRGPGGVQRTCWSPGAQCAGPQPGGSPSRARQEALRAELRALRAKKEASRLELRASRARQKALRLKRPALRAELKALYLELHALRVQGR